MPKHQQVSKEGATITDDSSSFELQGFTWEDLVLLQCFCEDRARYYRRLLNKAKLKKPLCPSYPSLSTPRTIEVLERFVIELRLHLFPLCEQDRGLVQIAQNSDCLHLVVCPSCKKRITVIPTRSRVLYPNCQTVFYWDRGDLIID